MTVRGGASHPEIRLKVWRQLYVQNHAPREAADRIEVSCVNAPSVAERVRRRLRGEG
jgi:hypothetical protein